MLKIFRRVKRKLLDEDERSEILSLQNQSEAMTERTAKRTGRMNRYLMYAIGEISLVVIGILIALQVNNWNNTRLNLNEEKIQLKAISEKMKHNRFQYEFGLNRNKEVIAAAEELLAMRGVPSSQLSKNKFEQNLYTLPKRFLMGKSNSTSIYDELIGAGQLNNISSQELRNNLTSLKANLQLLESYEDLQVNFVDNHLSPFLNKHVDRISVGVTGSKTDSTFYDNLIGLNYAAFNKNTIEQSYEELQKSREFANLLLELTRHTRTLLPIYNRIGSNISIIDSIAMEGSTTLNRSN